MPTQRPFLWYITYWYRRTPTSHSNRRAPRLARRPQNSAARAFPILPVPGRPRALPSPADRSAWLGPAGRRIVVMRCECGRVSRPTLGLIGPDGKRKRAKWCSMCPGKPEEAVNVTNKRCECGVASCPSFGLPEEGKKGARWCARCPGRPIEAVNVTNRRCECGLSQPSFGLVSGEGRRGAKWCAKCPGRPPEAMNVTNRRCQCGLSEPSYGYPGIGRRLAIWCSKCPGKPPEAIDVANKRCECGLRAACFGLLGEGRKGAKWCLKCPNKPDAAVDVTNRRCMCGMTTPSLALSHEKGRKAAKWCPNCPGRPEDAVDVIVGSKRIKLESSCAAEHPVFEQQPLPPQLPGGRTGMPTLDYPSPVHQLPAMGGHLGYPPMDAEMLRRWEAARRY